MNYYKYWLKMLKNEKMMMEVSWKRLFESKKKLLIDQRKMWDIFKMNSKINIEKMTKIQKN